MKVSNFYKQATENNSLAQKNKNLLNIVIFGDYPNR